jgi:ribonuclease D
MMIIERTINKDDIKDMPRATFPGRIIVVQTVAEAEKAVSYLRSLPLVGIDSETRPSFKKGQLHKVALLQVSGEECCFLFRLNMIDLPKCIVELLEDETTVKVGLSLKDDFMMLRKRGSFREGGVVELQEYVRTFGIEDKSLQKIYAILFKEKISKTQQLTNWEADVLSDAQKMYAATDAWSCLNIYRLLKELERTGDFEIAPRQEPEEEDPEVKPENEIEN